MTTSTVSTMPYTHRIATIEDAKALAPLMSAFLQERTKVDTSMQLKPNFDFEKYVVYQLSKPVHFTWVLEYSNDSNEPKIPVGFISIYFYDEAPPPEQPENSLQEHAVGHPFLPRRIGSVFGLYVQEEHRQPQIINLLIDTALQKADEMKVTDIDLLISEDQPGVKALVTRLGFEKAATQFIRHYDIPTDTELPRLHPPRPQIESPQPPTAQAIPLRNLQTNELVRNSQGEPIFMSPLTNEQGELLFSAKGVPIYPPPVLHPETREYLFDSNDKLVVQPILYDEKGQIFEREGIAQFHPPAFESVNGKFDLKKDSQGNYVFREVERDKDGNIVRTPDGFPVFQQNY